MKNYFIFYIILTILSLAFVYYPQGQPVQKTEPEQEQLITYKVSEIPVKLEESSSYLKNLSEEVVQPDLLKKLEASLNEILKNYSTLRAETDSVNLEEQWTPALREFQQKWNFQKSQISDWSNDVAGRTEKLEEQKKTLLGNRNIWLRTDTLAGKEKAGRNIRNNIRNIIDEFNKTETIVVNEVNSSLSLQTKLSEQSVDADQTIKKIEELLLIKKREIFVRNAPPVWESLTGRADTTTLSYQAKSIADSYIRTAEEFYRENKKGFLFSLIYLLLLLILVLILRHYSKDIKSDDPKVKRALEILKTPLSSTILIYLVALVLSYSEAPDVFFSLIRIVAVFPLLIILSRIINPSLRLPLYLFAILLILQQFKLTSASDTEIERLLLIIIIVMTLAGLIWMLMTKRFDKAFTKQSHENKAKFLAKFIIVLFIIAFIANMLGFVMLSLTIVNGTVNSTFSIIILLTATLALEAIILVFLQTKAAGSLNVVKNNPQKIEMTVSKVIKLVVIVWSLSIVLTSFGVREIVLKWLTETFSSKITIGSFSFSLWNLVLFVISIWLAVIVARFVRFILEGDVLPRLNLARGVPGAISAISSYLIVGFGILVAIMGSGIDLNSFALIAGALGVGIGFGLQDIVKNFISGLILIFEHPIQVGDAVQVDELSGRVKQIGIRSSTIKTWDGAEVIVPNGNLISNKLINWTLSDQLRRIDIKVGVAYGTNVSLVMETLLECAKLNEKILPDPPAYVLFDNFGESSLDFELRCWTADFGSWVEIRSDIRVAIDQAFKEKKIEIPFPQRDIHLKSGIDFPEQHQAPKER
ncbi:MAG: mechanosensitive ion channel [Ignavibacteriaceae bacterium]|jgi:small-conductance mechanosensitive channel|nr:mechanosensitive ion channel [Ignavibacterium sp.]MCU0412876.1 mechanosensitive ion channel [Ignavibacteriaceae bacterium]